MVFYLLCIAVFVFLATLFRPLTVFVSSIWETCSSAQMSRRYFASSLHPRFILLLSLSWHCPTLKILTGRHEAVTRGRKENRARACALSCLIIMQCAHKNCPREICRLIQDKDVFGNKAEQSGCENPLKMLCCGSMRVQTHSVLCRSPPAGNFFRLRHEPAECLTLLASLEAGVQMFCNIFIVAFEKKLAFRRVTFLSPRRRRQQVNVVEERLYCCSWRRISPFLPQRTLTKWQRSWRCSR